MQELQETKVPSMGWEDPWRRKWQPTPVFLPGKFQGQRSLVGCSLTQKESDMTEHESTYKTIGLYPLADLGIRTSEVPGPKSKDFQRQCRNDGVGKLSHCVDFMSLFFFSSGS